MEVENNARLVVDEVFDGGELLICDLAEVYARGQEFANQAVGVLVGAALPSAVWFAEVDVNIKVRAARSTQCGRQSEYVNFLPV